jgi:hypothetical protein
MGPAFRYVMTNVRHSQYNDCPAMADACLAWLTSGYTTGSSEPLTCDDAYTNQCRRYRPTASSRAYNNARNLLTYARGRSSRRCQALPLRSVAVKGRYRIVLI